MKKSILISREQSETRSCMLASGKLVNIDAEGPDGASIIGNIYKGTITDIVRSLNAAFVQIGEEREGFLSINDIHPAILEAYGRRPTMNEIFNKGQEILVQVLRDAVGGKGSMLTTCISLPGRYVVLMPASEQIGISKKLPDDERRRLRDIIAKVEVPDGFGVIVRTAGANKKKQELTRDLNQLVNLWNQIEKAYKKAKAPSLVVQEQSVAIRFLREYLTTDVSEIVVDDQILHGEVSRFLNMVMPKFSKSLSLYRDRLPLFVRYSVENQIENMFLRDVSLPSGGRIVIDKTEALVAVDVNSARQKGKDVEETALRTNLEAAEEIAAQMLLRDLSGLIVIDFIDMAQMKNRTQVQQRLRGCLKDDKAKFSVGRISQFGLLEMTRQRVRSGVVSRATKPCERCGGLGYTRTTPSNSLHILRRIRELAVGSKVEVIHVTAPVSVANFMQNSLRNPINQVETEYGVKVVIEGDPDVFSETVEQIRQTKDKQPPGPAPVEAPVYGREPVVDRDAEQPPADDKPQKDDGHQERGEPRKRGGRSPAKARNDGPSKNAGAADAKEDAQKSEEPKGRSRSRGGRRRGGANRTKAEGDKPAVDAVPEGKAEGAKRPARSRGRRPGRQQDSARSATAKPTGQGQRDGRQRTGRSPNKPADAPQQADYEPPRRTEHIPEPPPLPRAPAWDEPTPYSDSNKDGILDKVIKKLLGLDR